MRKSLKISCCLLILLSCSQKKGPLIYYSERIINLGNISFNKTFNGSIWIKNVGDETLNLSDISTDCSCTVPGIKKAKILPGDSLRLPFIITPAEDGFIQQSIYINNNSVNESRVLFLIRAKINLLNK
jgi:hypothetical protein